MVPLAEIAAGDYNLDLPRCMDSSAQEGLQDIEGHLKGGIPPERDIDSLDAAVQGDLDRVSQSLTGRIRELAERYDTPFPQLSA